MGYFVLSSVGLNVGGFCRRFGGSFPDFDLRNKNRSPGMRPFANSYPEVFARCQVCIHGEIVLESVEG